jgi:hypothetical protein
MSKQDIERTLRKSYADLSPRAEDNLTRLRHRYFGPDEAIHLGLADFYASVREGGQ